MPHNVHPMSFFISYYDAAANRTRYEQTGYTPGMSVKQLWMGQVLAAMASNPATMLDPETHIEYAVKLVELAWKKSDTW